MRHFFYFLTTVTLSAILYSCDNDTAKRIDIVRVETLVNKNGLNDSIETIMQPYLSVVSAHYGQKITLDDYLSSNAYVVFQADVDSLLPSLDEVEEKLYHICSRTKENGIHITNKRYVGIINPFSQPIVIADSIAYIGLNHYLGGNYAGYANFPQYVRKEKTTKRMAYDIIESSIAYYFPFKPEDKESVLNNILYEGAILYTLCQMGDDDVYTILGYDKQQERWITDNESHIWNVMAARQMIYAHDKLLADKLCKASPGCAIIHTECPPMIGRYMGYRIVCSYVNNNKQTTLEQLLSPDFYMSPQSLIQSKYNP